MKALLFLLLVGCGGTRGTQIEIKPPPPKMTTGTLAGALCSDGRCTCASGPADGGAGVPEDGRKRFEVRLDSAYDLWVTVDDRVLYKSPETATACFYIDLAPGNHGFAMRASKPNGVSFAVDVRELGTQTRDFYRTFHFDCGNPGVCSFDELADKGAEFRATRSGNVVDPCGSTKVKNVAWDHGHSPDQLHPSELVLQWNLDVYTFAPTLPHGDPSCGKRAPRE